MSSVNTYTKPGTKSWQSHFDSHRKANLLVASALGVLVLIVATSPMWMRLFK